MANDLPQLIEQPSTRPFVGRRHELRLLLRLLDGGGPTVAHVYGVAGSGKPAFVQAFVAAAEARGAPVTSVDARSCAPTLQGIVPAIRDALGLSTADGDASLDPLDEIGEFAGQTVIVIDTYELYRSLGSRLRAELLPRLPRSVRVLLAGREPPARQWLSKGQPGAFLTIRLDPLIEPEALELLEQLGAAPAIGRRINAVTRGHPLALTMAATLQLGRHDREPEDLAVDAVVGMEMRPHLRHVYACRRTTDMTTPYKLGFTSLPQATREIDGVEFHTIVVDMGTASVEGWLARAIANELGVGVTGCDAPLLDIAARELAISDRRVGLTPLEFGVLRHLTDNPGVAISRDELLQEVWGHLTNHWSNVVDSLIAGLRRKLGPHGSMIETVRGTGYRYSSDQT